MHSNNDGMDPNWRPSFNYDDERDKQIDALERELAEVKEKLEHTRKANHQVWNDLRAKDMKLTAAMKLIELADHIIEKEDVAFPKNDWIKAKEGSGLFGGDDGKTE